MTRAVLALLLGCAVSGTAWAQTGVLKEMDGEMAAKALPACACFSFDDGEAQGWHSPDLFEGQGATVPCDLFLTPTPDDSAGQVLGLDFTFSDKRWSATGISWTGPVDLQPFDTLTADIYLPHEVAGRQLSARFIIMVGKNWQWCQAKTGTPLVAGQWVTMSIPLKDLSVHRSEVQSLMIRIEGSTFKGSEPRPVSAEIYIDNIRLE